jgi:hypothetical protein
MTSATTLAAVLDHFLLLYIVIDIEAVSAAYAKSTKNFSWLSSFSTILKSLSKERPKTRLKVLLVSYGSAKLQEPKLALFQDLVVSTQLSIQSPSQKRRRYSIMTGRAKQELCL